MTEAAEIAAKLTEAQRRALTHAAFLLDAMAGEGVGVEVEMVDGCRVWRLHDACRQSNSVWLFPRGCWRI